MGPLMDTGPTSGMADRQLLAALAAGDRAALATAFDRHAPTVLRYAWGLADTPDDAQRLVQDTLAALWREAPTLVLATSALLPWLLVTCRDLHVASTPADADADARARHRPRFVGGQVDALPELDRRLVELALGGGHSYQDAARVLGRPVAATARPARRTTKQRTEAVNHGEH